MGKSGSPPFRSKWDCAGYESQTPEFVAGIDEDGAVRWGYTGQRTGEARDGIGVEDVRWLYRYIGRITDGQLREGLSASGATEEEIECFTKVHPHAPRSTRARQRIKGGRMNKTAFN
jgi:hypothetical protein